MKKKITGIVLLAVMLFQTAMTASAETTYGDSKWSVTFTSGKEMVSNFKSSDFNDKAYGLQPGDDLIIRLKLKNENSTATDWYMTNKVLQSMEDVAASTSGGAYEYDLTYTGPDGKEEELYSSDTVGGEKGSGGRVGLREATSALENYFYLDTLKKGQSGTIKLRVGLDGETQGNTYQNTLADLQMNFAVELRPTQGGPGSNNDDDGDGGSGTTGGTNGRGAGVVQTSDDTNMLPYIIAAAVSGTALLFVGFYGRRERRKTEKEAG